MRVLLVKLSSMGDLIHTLPALTDAMQLVPGVQFTWLVDASFQEIAHWHPAVDMVIPIELRKRNLKQIYSTIKRLRVTDYDLIIDAQGLFKSAVLTRLARGKIRSGYDKSSSRESIASFLYNHKCSVPRDLHAVDRMRQLFAQAFAYALPNSSANYGINWSDIVLPQTSSEPYLVFLHGTTWESKHWPDEYWVQLADLAAHHKLNVQVTWATDEQRQRALRFSAYSNNITMLPHLNLLQALSLLYHSQGAVAVDTGFAHLAAALSKPTVAIYGATDARKSGTVGSNSINLSSKFACAPCSRRLCTFAAIDTMYPPCYKEISPEYVWRNLSGLLGI